MAKMLAGQISGYRRLEMIEMPVPEPETGEIVIRLEAGAVCGSDIPYYLYEVDYPGILPSMQPVDGRFPALLSLHELVGHVAATRTPRFREGDRVLALPTIPHFGLGEYFTSSEALAVPIPAGPAERLVLSQPLGTVVHACRHLPNVLGQTAVVLGQGPIGQFFTALLRRMGVTRLVAVDLLPERLEVSPRMGATHTVCGGADAVREVVWELTGGAGADLVVEAAGNVDAFNLAAALVRRCGILLGFGVPHTPAYQVDYDLLFRKEGRIITSLGPDVQREFPIAIDLVASGAIDVGPLITHRYPLERAPDAFDLFADRREGVLKAILTTAG